MTAINIFVKPDVAYVVSDGAAIDNGISIRARSKCLIVPKFNAVVAYRGNACMLAPVHTLIEVHAFSFDEVAEDLGSYLRRAAELLGISSNGKFSFIGPQELFLIGWPQGANCPRAYVTSTSDRDGFEPYSTTAIACAIGPQVGAVSDGLELSPYQDPDTLFDPEHHALPLIEAQRRIPGAMIGGFCQVTTIERDRISTRVVKNWDEEEEDVAA